MPTKTADTEIENDDPQTVAPNQLLTEYTCVRCGFVYHKNIDYDPTLCYRCMRFIAKRVYTIMQQVIPPVSTPTSAIGDI